MYKCNYCDYIFKLEFKQWPLCPQCEDSNIKKLSERKWNSNPFGYDNHETEIDINEFIKAIEDMEEMHGQGD